MFPFFWRIFLSFLLITAFSIAACTTWETLPTFLTEIFNTQLPQLVLLLAGEAGLAGLVSFLLYNPIHKLRLDLSGKILDQSARKRIEKRPDEIGALATAISKRSLKYDAAIDDLMAQQRYLATILENLNDGICIVNDRGSVLIINQATKRMFQIPESSVSGQTLIETIRHHRVLELWQNCQISGMQQTVQLETSMDRNYLQCIATPLEPKHEGNILLLFQDVTRLHQLEIVRRDFVSNVSHELRTPLTSLKLITETLSDSAMDDPPAQRKFLKQMETEIDNLTQLVQELLELSRIESGLVPLQKTAIDPCTLVNEAATRMQVQAERAGLSFTWNCEDNLPIILVDTARLGQVLINLIHNAIKFTPPGGKIHVSVQKEKETVVFSVSDTGIGIPQYDIDRIFERFYKTDRSRSKSGTGLGLSIARHLVEAHDGKLWVESTVGKGSTFSFSISIK